MIGTVKNETGKSIQDLPGLKPEPFLCVITPVFDPAYESVVKLINALKLQSFGQFIHILVSNGRSSKIKAYIDEIRIHDQRFIYDEIKEEKLESGIDILVNLGKRRNYCLKQYDAARYVMLDADLQIIKSNYFLKLYEAHEKLKADVICTKIRIREKVFPRFPLKLGRIDLANVSFSKSIAKHFDYPTDYDPHFGIGNDYRFFSKFIHDDNTVILDVISAVKDGNASYKRVLEIIKEEKGKDRQAHVALWKHFLNRFFNS